MELSEKTKQKKKKKSETKLKVEGKRKATEHTKVEINVLKLNFK